ncbi:MULTISPECIES: tripartite tricarboxylate transporter permease [unclassified Marinobacter]|uniref:tripartite tricarboxylate transporter permease n=1 Tax=unclassified Marinobacter TaxID=83889 RepID=UPI0018F1B091|nr:MULTISPECIES: tripartite tricarboxylate transporter permease [unclassified Marinobacter]
MTGLGDRILGLGLLVLAVAYGWVAQQWPEPFGGAETVGPETFPTILSVVLVVGSLYLMVKPDPDAQWPVGKSALELVVSLVVLVAYALLLEPLGFVIATTMAVGTLSWRMGANPKPAFMTGLLSAIVVFVLFNYGLSLSLPAGLLELYEGIDFILAIVGLFAISELLFFVEHRMGSGRDKMSVGKITLSFKEIVSTIPTQLRGGILGFISGVLPGAGASLGSFISYTLEKQVIGKKGKFGEGDIRGVVAPEAGNNGASSGALVPMLTLGVPGSGTTAVLLAMLISLNITPGPLMFTQNADIVWGVIAALLIGNLLLLGPEMEKNLAHAMVLSDGEWSILWGSPLAMGLWVFAGLGLALPYLVGPILRRRMRAAIKETPVSD